MAIPTPKLMQQPMPKMTDYPGSTVFALNPSFDLDSIRPGTVTGDLNKRRLEWLGLEGKSVDTIKSTQNPYLEHPQTPTPLTHLGWDKKRKRIIEVK